MRKIGIAFIVALCLASCVSIQTAGRRAGERREVQQRVYDDINSRRFTIHFDYVLPHSIPARYLTTTYSLSVNGDSIDSYLPYFGVAYRSKFPDDTQSPLIFQGHATGFSISQYKKDGRRITFNVKNGDELLGYDLIVFDNGRASLKVQSSDREGIDFSGNVSMPASVRK